MKSDPVSMAAGKDSTIDALMEDTYALILFLFLSSGLKSSFQTAKRVIPLVSNRVWIFCVCSREFWRLVQRLCEECRVICIFDSIHLRTLSAGVFPFS